MVGVEAVTMVVLSSELVVALGPRSCRIIVGNSTSETDVIVMPIDKIVVEQFEAGVDVVRSQRRM